MFGFLGLHEFLRTLRCSGTHADELVARHGALAVAEGMPGRTGEALASAAREAFTAGMQAAAVAGAVLLFAAAVLGAMTLRRIRVREEHEEALSPSGV